MVVVALGTLLGLLGVSECNCEKVEIRERIVRGGARHAVWQCVECGRALPSAVPREKLNGTPLRPFDERLRERYSEERAQEYRERHEAWLAEHDEYLKSQEWLERRGRVMARAHGLCEGCGKRRATQVHHTSYRHWKRELLFELVAVCDACHDIAHNKSR